MEPRFQFNTCPHCQTQNTGLPFCRQCQALQPFPKGASYFDLFGVSPALKVEVSELKEKYYSWIKKLHPDRFVQGSDEQKKLSLLWSTQLNTAYKTFCQESFFQEYLLKFFNIKLPSGKTSLPSDLLEAFFDLEENPSPEAKQKIISDIEKEEKTIQIKIESLNQTFKTQKDKKDQMLKDWVELIALKNYLNSMKEARGLK